MVFARNNAESQNAKDGISALKRAMLVTLCAADAQRLSTVLVELGPCVCAVRLEQFGDQAPKPKQLEPPEKFKLR